MGKGRKRQFATQGNRGNLSFNEAWDQAIQNAKDKPTCHSPSFVQPNSTHTQGGISSGSLTPVLDVSHVHLAHAAPLAQRQSCGSPKQQARYPIAPRLTDRKLNTANGMTRCFCAPLCRRHPPIPFVQFPDMIIPRPWPAQS